MFEKMTDQARRVVVLAQESARVRRHLIIDTDDFLLALTRQGEWIVGEALAALGISHEGIESKLGPAGGQGIRAPSGHIPFSPDAKEALELSVVEAAELGDRPVSTEHLLLGLTRLPECRAAQVLSALGVELDRLRDQVLQLREAHRQP